MSHLFNDWAALPAEAQAAWVQAIFSVLGIGVAIAIPALQHLKDRRDRIQRELREARALALLLIPTLNAWIDNLSTFQKQVNQHLDAHFAVGVDWKSIADALMLGEQGKLIAPKSHLLGPISADAQRFFHHLATAQQAARNNSSESRSRSLDRELVEVVGDLLEKARESAILARTASHKLFDTE